MSERRESIPDQIQRWNEAVARINDSPELQRDIMKSVRGIMEDLGFGTNDERSRKLLQEALGGPVLVYDPSLGFRDISS